MDSNKLFDTAIDFVIEDLYPLVDEKENELTIEAEDDDARDSISLDMTVFTTFGIRLAYMGWTVEELCDILTQVVNAQMEYEVSKSAH